MGLSIQTNIAAMDAHRNLVNTSDQLTQSMERLSSGYRIDRMIEREVPRGEKVFAFEQVAETWTTRKVLVGYTAADNEVLVDILHTPLDPASFPERGWAFRFDLWSRRRKARTDSENLGDADHAGQLHGSSCIVGATAGAQDAGGAGGAAQ